MLYTPTDIVKLNLLKQKCSVYRVRSICKKLRYKRATNYSPPRYYLTLEQVKEIEEYLNKDNNLTGKLPRYKSKKHIPRVNYWHRRNKHS